MTAMPMFSDIERLKVEHAKRYVDDMIQASSDYQVMLDKIDAIDYAAQPGGIRYDKESVTTSTNPDQIPNAVIRSLELKEDLEDAIKQFEDEDWEFRRTLMLIDSVGGLYYWEFYTGRFKTWNQIWKHYRIDRKTGVKRCQEALLEMYDRDMIPQQYKIPNYRAI